MPHRSTSTSSVNNNKLRCSSVKYSGSKLSSKGVLLTIDGLPESQFKNVLFEFVPSDGADGVFEVHATFMGVRLEKVELELQELLELQYQVIQWRCIKGLYGSNGHEIATMVEAAQSTQ